MEMSENLFLHLHVLDESPSKSFTKKIIGYSVRCPHPKENTYAYKKAKAKNTTNGLELKKKKSHGLKIIFNQ